MHQNIETNEILLSDTGRKAISRLKEIEVLNVKNIQHSYDNKKIIGKVWSREPSYLRQLYTALLK